MKMKYFQHVGHIKNHYDNIFEYLETPHGLRLLDTWDIRASEKDYLNEEREVLTYLLSCHLSIAHGENNAKKPTLETVKRCFERHLFFLDKIHKCNSNTFNTHRLTSVKKQYQTCRHYLFKFSLPAWYEKLPDEILSFQNKYPDFEH